MARLHHSIDGIDATIIMNECVLHNRQQASSPAYRQCFRILKQSRLSLPEDVAEVVRFVGEVTGLDKVSRFCVDTVPVLVQGYISSRKLSTYLNTKWTRIFLKILWLMAIQVT